MKLFSKYKPEKECHKAKICFPKLCFTKPGVYCYRIMEYAPTCNDWKTDRRAFRVIITITQDCHGDLKEKICYPDGYPKFVNRYCPPKPSCECHCEKCNKKSMHKTGC